LRFEEVAPATLGPTQARIRVRACGCQFCRHADDRWQVPGEAGVPFTPGLEAAAMLSKSAARSPTCMRAKRCWRCCGFGGAYAEEIVLDAAAVVPIPDAMDYVTAAAFPVVYGTSHFGLTHRGNLKAGETCWCLVLPAASASLRSRSASSSARA